MVVAAKHVQTRIPNTKYEHKQHKPSRAQPQRTDTSRCPRKRCYGGLGQRLIPSRVFTSSKKCVQQALQRLQPPLSLLQPSKQNRVPHDTHTSPYKSETAVRQDMQELACTSDSCQQWDQGRIIRIRNGHPLRASTRGPGTSMSRLACIRIAFTALGIRRTSAV